MNGAHFSHDLQVEMQAFCDTKYSQLSARWQEISELFETPSIGRGTTLVHRHIVKVSLDPFSWLVARSRQIQKIMKMLLRILEISLVQKSHLALTLILW